MQEVREIYIEYALIENFLIDAMLLWLSFKAAKMPISRFKIALAACIGAGFAVLFPLLKIGKIGGYLLKFSVGALLCFVAYKGKIEGKGGGRYALTVILFYAFSFALGGGLLAAYNAFSIDYAAGGGYITASMPIGGVAAGCVLFFAGSTGLIKKFYRRRNLHKFIYSCELTCGSRTVKADGFLDSGNRAMAAGMPVCFLSADLVFELLDGAQMTEETEILTVSGEKKIKIFPIDRIEIYCEGQPNIIKKAYLSPSSNIRAREYKVLLNAHLFE